MIVSAGYWRYDGISFSSIFRTEGWGLCPGREMIAFVDIERALGGREPELLADYQGTHAAVALLLRESPGGLEMLFIERAAHDHDPWSGNVGFPGGKVEESDGNDRDAAERETLEEIGFDLRHGLYLGRLSDISGAHLPVRVSCFAYAVRDSGPLTLSEEVSDAFWVNLDELFDPARHGEFTVRFDGKTLVRPAIRLSQPGKPLLWGITYRLVMQFREILPALGNHFSNGQTSPRREKS